MKIDWQKVGEAQRALAELHLRGDAKAQALRSRLEASPADAANVLFEAKQALARLSGVAVAIPGARRFSESASGFTRAQRALEAYLIGSSDPAAGERGAKVTGTVPYARDVSREASRFKA